MSFNNIYVSTVTIRMTDDASRLKFSHFTVL